MNVYRRILPTLTATTLTIFALLLVSGGRIATAEPDIDAMIKMIESGTSGERIQVAKSLAYTGITDKRLFDAMNQVLRSTYPNAGEDRQQLEEASHLCRGLATSGRPEYKATFEEILASGVNKKLKRHATKSLEQIDDFAAWNPYINSKDYAQEGRTAEDAKHISMIKSGIPVLQRKGAGDIMNSRTRDEAVYDIIADELTKGYTTPLSDRTGVDVMSWFCRALGASGNAKYRDVLEKVRLSAPSKKLRGYAGKALKALD